MAIKDMTTGNPAKLILGFALPVFIGNLFQQFYNVADSVIVGRTLGIQALAAVGATGAIVFLVLGFVFGTTSGFAVVTAQRFGAQDYNGVRKSFTTTILLSIMLTLVITLISTLTAMPLLKIMNTPQDIIQMAHQYLFVFYLGIGTIIFYNALSNTIRALGDSKTPLFFLIIASALNIILDLYFIIKLQKGVAGAAWATVIAQGVSALLCAFYMFIKFPILRLKKSDWTININYIKENLRIGLPMGFQMSILTIGIIAVQIMLNSFGSNTVAAFTAATKVDQLSTQYFLAIGAAMATYTAQNYGAGKFNRIRIGVRKCVLINIILSLTSAILILLFGRQMTGLLFTPDTPEFIYNQAQTYLNIIIIFYFAFASILLFRNVLQGIGNAKIPLISGVLELVTRTAGAFVFGHYFGYLGVCFATPFAWVTGAAWLIAGYNKTMKKLIFRNPNHQKPLDFLSLNE